MSAKEEFDFLGYTFGPRYAMRNARSYMAARPSKKSIQRLTGKVYDLLRPHEKGSWPEVRDRLNAQLRGWQRYFSHGTIARAYQIVNNYVEKRVRNFLRQRCQHWTLGTRRFPSQLIFGELRVMRLARRTACG
ncbi:MAG TPA: group II intron maturase-specific domain-containing protein [Verrucomicrobiae bacterium]|nr:group II intron maturase-specific domain-containing protein [Verrucomicrobiae bacterium]